MELADKIYDRVTELSVAGDELAAESMYGYAAEKYMEALRLLPLPAVQWEAAGWLLTALGDVSFLAGKFSEAADYLYQALNCPATQDNPFVHLRLGQSLLGQADLQSAEQHLLKAYMLGGDEIFESEDPVYFNTIKKIIQ